MSLSNLPPGMTERDIPGFLDIDAEWTIKCPHCGYEGLADASITPATPRRDGHGTADCPACYEVVEFEVQYDP